MSLRSGKAPVTEDCDPDAQGWWSSRYQNCRSLELYLGDTNPWFIEVLAVRLVQWLNRCLTLDWCYESCIIRIARETGPGFRVGGTLTAINVVCFSHLYLGRPLLFQYDIISSVVEMRFGNVTLGICMFLWAFDFALLAVAYTLVRWHNCRMQEGTMGECTPFFRQRVTELRETRERRPVSTYQHLLRVGFVFFYFLYFVIGTLAIHTLLAQMYHGQNPWFARLFVMVVVFALFSSLDDLTQIGSPWGIQELSKTASILLSYRAIVAMPVTLVWSIAAVYASFPPWECALC